MKSKILGLWIALMLFGVQPAEASKYDPCKIAGGCSPRTSDIETVGRAITLKERQLWACQHRLKCTPSEIKKHTKALNKLKTEYQMKYSLPLAPFFITLLVAPLGILMSKFENAMSVALSIGLVFVWYVLFSTFLPLGYTGKVPPFWAAWIQNLLFAFLGLLLMLKLTGWPEKLRINQYLTQE